MKAQAHRALALIAGLAAVLGLAATPAWAASGNPSGKRANAAASGSGIVQAIRGRSVFVRELDGRVVRFRVRPQTAVYVDGVRTRVGKLEPGFVVTFTDAELRASDPSPSVPRVPVVQSVGDGGVVVTRPNGSTRAIAVGPATRLLLNGRAVSLGELRPGDVLVKAVGKRPALVLRFRRPG